MIFSVSESFSILIANKIFNVTVFLAYLFTFAINLRLQKFVTADVTAVFVKNQRGFSDGDEILIKKFVFEKVHSREVDRLISREKLDRAFC